MKILKLSILFSLFLTASTSLLADEARKYIVPPFENFSPYKSKTDYEITINDINNPEILIIKSFPIDQYSETARSFLENQMVNINVKVIERMRVDQLLSESNLTRKNGFVNEQSALEMGKQVGADTLVMGSILGFQFKKEKVTAYGLNQELLSTVCTLRVRIIDIESGNVYFSKIFKGKFVVSSSNSVGNEVSDRAFASLEDSITQLMGDSNFTDAISD